MTFEQYRTWMGNTDQARCGANEQRHAVGCVLFRISLKISAPSGVDSFVEWKKSPQNFDLFILILTRAKSKFENANNVVILGYILFFFTFQVYWKTLKLVSKTLLENRVNFPQEFYRYCSIDFQQQTQHLNFRKKKLFSQNTAFFNQISSFYKKSIKTA